MAEEIVNLTQQIALDELHKIASSSNMSTRTLLEDANIQTRIISYVMAHEQSLYVTLDDTTQERLSREIAAAPAQHRLKVHKWVLTGIQQLQQDRDGELDEQELADQNENRTNRQGRVSHWFG
jgi:hypothetical protein